MITFLSNLGRYTLQKLIDFGVSGLFIVDVLIRRPKFKRLFMHVIKEIYHVGVLSLFIIVLSGLFLGFVVSLQAYNTLEKFGSTPQLGQVLALSIVRELGPVLGAILFAGRAGSALTAEIGLMQATEQISSMDIMGVDAKWRIILPRLLAGIISLPVLTMIFNVVAIYGGYLVGVKWLGVDDGIFWNNMQSAVEFRMDILSGLWKSIAFGAVVTWIAVYQGYYSIKTAEGVASATTRTVVFSSIAILVVDFILTAVMIGGW